MLRRFIGVLFVNWYWRAGAILIAAVGVLGAVREELPEDRQDALRLYRYLPDWAWYVWVIAALAAFLVLTVAAFWRHFVAQEEPRKRQTLVTKCAWRGRELHRECFRRKRVMKKAEAWAVETNAVVSEVLGPAYGYRFKEDFGAPSDPVPPSAKDYVAWEYLNKRLFKLGEIITDMTKQITP